jgi:hypothetical protein
MADTRAPEADSGRYGEGDAAALGTSPRLCMMNA